LNVLSDSLLWPRHVDNVLPVRNMSLPGWWETDVKHKRNYLFSSILLSIRLTFYPANANHFQQNRIWLKCRPKYCFLQELLFFILCLSIKRKLVPVFNYLSTKPLRRMGEWIYRSVFSWTRQVVGGEWSGSRPSHFTPGEKAPGTHWIGGWLNPRVGLDDVEKRKFLTLLGLELRTFRRPARSQSLYRLLYPGSYVSTYKFL
jgi:hypothetical protein